MPGQGRDAFVSTRWSLVLRAGTQPSTGADAALATLCETYWYPLYAFLRRRGHDAEDAQDLTQAFFARLLEKRTLRQADPARGRFRSFLLAALQHFVANERDRDRAKKRGGGVPVLSLEFETAEGRFLREPPTEETPEKVFDRQWAMTLLERTMARLDEEMATLGRQAQYERLRIYLTGDDGLPGYATIGQDLGMSEGAVKVAVHRLRRRFRDLLRSEISETIGSADEIDDEIRHLWSSLGA